MARTIYKRTGSRGGITVPASLRREMGLEPGDPVDITLTDGNKIEVSQHIPRCLFCGSDEDVRLMHGKGICRRCFREMEET